MIRRSRDLKAAALETLSQKWGGAVTVTLIYMLLCSVLPSVLAGEESLMLNFLYIIVYVLVIPIGWSFAVMFLELKRTGTECKVGRLFDGYKDFTRICGTLFLTGIYIFLWTLLLIIPGIVKSYSYSMTGYVLKDHPELSFDAAIERSMLLMQGHKMDLFILHLTFIGWALLSLFTFGIGILWLLPYMEATQVQFYEDIKEDMESKFGNAA